MLGGVPPLLHVHHGGILHAIGEHRPPQHEWRPRRRHLLIPAGLRLLLQLPGSRVCPPPRPGAPNAARTPGVHRSGPGDGGGSRRVRGLRAPRGSPRRPAARPFTPARQPRSARPLALSAARWVRRELAEHRRGGGVSRRRGDGAWAPEPAVSALGRGRRRPFAALRFGLRGDRRWRRLWAQEAEAGPGRQGREGREGSEGKRAGRGSGPGEGLGATGRGLQPGPSGRGGPTSPHPSAARSLRPGAARG